VVLFTKRHDWSETDTDTIVVLETLVNCHESTLQCNTIHTM